MLDNLSAHDQDPVGQHQPELSVSVVIEWENVGLSGESRAAAMLQALATQLREQDADFEVIFVVNPEEHALSDVEAIVARFFIQSEAVRFLSHAEHGYFAKKNAGAQAAENALLMFVDSDVIPEPGWLAGLVGAFADPEVDIVSGVTYMEVNGWYSRSMAAFWFFPPRPTESGLVPTRRVFANNIAFRRALFLANPFPELPEFRGHIGLMGKQLEQKGIAMYCQNGSRCSHPPPNGFWHFIKRAVAEGYDNFSRERRSQEGGRVPLRSVYWSARNWSNKVGQNIAARKQQLGLTPWRLTIARLLAYAYIALMVLGELLSRLMPQTIKKHFEI